MPPNPYQNQVYPPQEPYYPRPNPLQQSNTYVPPPIPPQNPLMRSYIY